MTMVRELVVLFALFRRAGICEKKFIGSSSYFLQVWLEPVFLSPCLFHTKQSQVDH